MAVYGQLSSENLYFEAGLTDIASRTKYLLTLLNYGD